MSAELVKAIKQKKPSLSELKGLFKKHKITDRIEIFGLMMKHNLLQYVKKDKKFATLKKRPTKTLTTPTKILARSKM
jgi:hypothetical protein